ncbi:MAG: universal stress protein [Pseudomonadota bacterium]
MTMILACIDGSVYSGSVAEHAAWAAKRLNAQVELLQVLGRRAPSADDRSGRIVAGGRRRLLEELAKLDAERAKVMHEKGWMELDEARAQLEALGVTGISSSLRHGDILETLEEREGDTDLVVLGKRGEAADFAKLHLGSNLERILRASKRPVLVAARAFKPINKVMIAFDGRPGAQKTVDGVSRSPLFQGLSCTLVTVGRDDAEMTQKVEAAAAQLKAGGIEATTRMEPGEANTVIPGLVESEGFDILVMGAYGHSRLRTLVIGSTTSEMIRACLIPILVWR